MIPVKVILFFFSFLSLTFFVFFWKRVAVSLNISIEGWLQLFEFVHFWMHWITVYYTVYYLLQQKESELQETNTQLHDAEKLKEKINKEIGNIRQDIDTQKV